MINPEEMEELDWRLELGENGIKVHRGADAVRNNLDQWLATPAGTVADWPSWGNNLHEMKFLPHTEAAVFLEMKLKPKIEKDVRGCRVRRILCKSMEADLLAIYIDFGFGEYQTAYNRAILGGL